MFQVPDNQISVEENLLLVKYLQGSLIRGFNFLFTALNISGCWFMSMSTMETWSSGYMGLCISMDILLGRPAQRFSLALLKRKSIHLSAFQKF